MIHSTANRHKDRITSVLQPFFPNAIIPDKPSIMSTVGQMLSHSNPNYRDTASSLINFREEIFSSICIPGRKLPETSKVADNYRTRYHGVELLMVLLLDINSMIIGENILANGRTPWSSLNINNLLELRATSGAVGIFLVQTQLNGTPRIGDDEMKYINLFYSKCPAVMVVDALVVTPNDYTSFSEIIRRT